MDQFLRQLVGRIVKDTDFLLSDGTVTWAAARAGIIQIMENLVSKHPIYAVEIKGVLEPYIIRNDTPNPPKFLPGFSDVQQARLEDGATMIIENKRRHQRIVPIVREAKMQLPDGSEEIVKILNVSISGIGIQTSARPAFGSEVVVGATHIMVVRHFADGIAGRFLRPLPQDALRETIRL